MYFFCAESESSCPGALQTSSGGGNTMMNVTFSSSSTTSRSYILWSLDAYKESIKNSNNNASLKRAIR